MQERKSGWKCFDCIGHTSTNWEELRAIHNNDEQNINNQIQTRNISYINTDLTGQKDRDYIENSNRKSTSDALTSYMRPRLMTSQSGDAQTNSNNNNGKHSELKSSRTLKKLMSKRNSVPDQNKIAKKSEKIKAKNNDLISANNNINNPLIKSSEDKAKILKNSPLASVLNLDDKGDKKSKSKVAALKRHKFTFG